MNTPSRARKSGWLSSSLLVAGQADAPTDEGLLRVERARRHGHGGLPVLDEAHVLHRRGCTEVPHRRRPASGT